jgi:hypothetical protein
LSLVDFYILVKILILSKQIKENLKHIFRKKRHKKTQPYYEIRLGKIAMKKKIHYLISVCQMYDIFLN